MAQQKNLIQLLHLTTAIMRRRQTYQTPLFPPLQPTEPFSSTHILAGGCPALYSTSSEDDILQECVRAKNKGYASCR